MTSSKEVQKSDEFNYTVLEATKTVASDKELKVKNRTHCNDCANRAICKFSDAVLNSVSELHQMNLPEVVAVDMKCMYFKCKDQPVVKKATHFGNARNSGIQITHTKHEASVGDEI